MFALALEKPLTERSAFLQAVCGKDDVLRQRLEALLSAHDQPDNLVPTQAEAVRQREDASALQARPTIKQKMRNVGIPNFWVWCVFYSKAIQQEAREVLRSQGIAVPDTEAKP